MIDAVFGSIANFVASMLAYLIAKRGAGIKLKILGAASEAVVVSIIVGTYLKFLLEWAMGIDLPLLLSVLGVLGGSIVSIVIIGVPVAVIVEKNFPRLK
jgi:hypothetical protein